MDEDGTFALTAGNAGVHGSQVRCRGTTGIDYLILQVLREALMVLGCRRTLPLHLIVSQLGLRRDSTRIIGGEG